jgi:von Willebrand factor type A domain
MTKPTKTITAPNKPITTKTAPAGNLMVPRPAAPAPAGNLMMPRATQQVAPRPAGNVLAPRPTGNLLDRRLQRDYLVLDRSGSMADIWDAVLTAISGYVRSLKDDKVSTSITFAVFDHEYQIVRKDVAPANWRGVTTDEAEPRGATALNDAIGSIVAQAKEENPAKATLVFATDGGDNASKMTTEEARALLDECRARGWDVIFLGVGHDNSELAQSYGADPSQTIAVDKDTLAATMQKIAVKRASGQRITFSATEKKDAGRRLLLR